MKTHRPRYERAPPPHRDFDEAYFGWSSYCPLHATTVSVTGAGRCLARKGEKNDAINRVRSRSDTTGSVARYVHTYERLAARVGSVVETGATVEGGVRSQGMEGRGCELIGDDDYDFACGFSNWVSAGIDTRFHAWLS